MKFSFILITLMISHVALAQSQRQVKIKTEMLDRTDLLIEKVEGTREDLDQQDVVGACKKIKEVFVLFPEHLKALGTRMDLDRSRSIKAKDEALSQLIFIHKKSLVCDQGKDSEYVDAKKLRKELKGTLKSLEKQKKLIKNTDMENENTFYYEYEF